MSGRLETTTCDNLSIPITIAPMRMMDGLLTLNRAEGDLEGQIYRALRDAILAGRITAGAQLPATRPLAQALGVARSTVVQAFERLRAEGYIEALQGSVTRVSALPPLPSAPSDARTRRISPPGEARSAREAVREGHDASGAFVSGVPDLSAFPHAVWARYLAARARAPRLHNLGYGSFEGLRELREAILAHVISARGVVATADQVVVVPSTSAAIDLITHVVLRPGDSAWIEEPGYGAAQAVLRESGARLVPVPCDEEGLDPCRAPSSFPRLVYVTPSHQYPTGATMSLSRRLALLQAAESVGAVILEDDYDSEFQYGGRPIACLQGIDRSASVAYLGTFSKTLAPGLRLAYAILPPWLVADVMAAQALRGAVVPIHIQAAMADFLRDGHPRAHIRRMTTIYRERMGAALAAVRRHCCEFLLVPEQRGGLQFATWFREPTYDDVAITDTLWHTGVRAKPLSTFYLGQSRSGLLLGIGTTTAIEADAAAARIRRAFLRL